MDIYRAASPNQWDKIPQIIWIYYLSEGCKKVFHKYIRVQNVDSTYNPSLRSQSECAKNTIDGLVHVYTNILYLQGILLLEGFFSQFILFLFFLFSEYKFYVQ